MPIQKIEFTPGVNRETTNYANEGGYFLSEKVRFRGGFPQKIGGWQSINSNQSTFKGVARFLWNYITLLSQNLLFVATNQKIYVEFGGVYNDITPLRTTATLGSNPIGTTSGSRLVTITHSSHGAIAGTFITISGASAVGGLTISGEYEIIGVPSSNTYTIIAASAASSTASGGGASVSVEYQINAGTSVYSSVSGYGSGGYGLGGYGSDDTTGVSMRLWSGLNYGDDFIFCERAGDIYYWTEDTATWARGTTLSDKINTLTKINAYATFASGVSTIVVDDVTGINTGCVISGSGIPSGAYVTTAWTGSTSLTLSAATTSSGTVTAIAASYAGRHAPNEAMVVSLSPVEDFLISFGAKPYSPIDFSTAFDPMLVRWSDQENPYEWVPEISNQSGEKRLSNGSYIVTSEPTRQEVIVFTDSAVYSMQYVGPPFVWAFSLMDQDTSIASQNAVVSANNILFWMGEDKFYIYDGRVQVLACSVARYVFSEINKEQIFQVFSGFNEAFNEVWWFYPAEGSRVCNRYVAYNYLDSTWHHGSMNRTAYAHQHLREYPMIANSIQTSYLSSAINSSDTTITVIDGKSFPSSGTILIDSEQISYTGVTGNTITGCTRGVNSTTAASHSIYASVRMRALNQVLFHEVGFDDLESGVPEPISAYIETSDVDIGDGDRFSFISKIIPDVRFLGSSASSPCVSLAVYPRNHPGDSYGSSGSGDVIATAVAPIDRYTDQVHIRVRGRQAYFRISSSTLGTAWQMGAMRIEIRPDGRR